MMAALICLTCFFSCIYICVYLSNNFLSLLRQSVYFLYDIFNSSKLSSKLSNRNIDFEAELTKVGHFGLRSILVGANDVIGVRQPLLVKLDCCCCLCEDVIGVDICGLGIKERVWNM